MKFGRRAGALLCTLCLSLSVMGFSASAAEETLFTESFDSDTVGAFPANQQIELNVGSMTEGGHAMVMEEDGRTYLDIVDNNMSVGEGIKINLPSDKYPVTGKMTLTFDVYMKSDTAAGFMVNAMNAKNQNELSVTVEQNKINQNISTRNADDKVTTVSENFTTTAGYTEDWKKITFVMDLDQRTIDGYLGAEKLKTVRFRWGDEYAGEAITQIQFLGRGGVKETQIPKTISLDNIAVYNYEVLPTSEPSAVIYEESFDTVGPIEENEILKLHKTLADGSSVMVTEEEDRSYLEIIDMDPISGDGIRLDIPQEQQQSSGKMTLAFDVKMESDTKAGFMVNARNAQNQNELSANFEKNRINQNISVPAPTTAVMTENTGFVNSWKRLTFILDLDNRSIDTYVDNEKTSTVPFRWGEQYQGEPLTQIQIIGRGDSAGFTAELLPKTIAVDNLVLYGKEVLPEGVETPEEPGEPQVLVDENFDDMTVDSEPTRGEAQCNTEPDKMSENTYIHVVERPDGESGDLAVKVHDCTINDGNSRYIYPFEKQTGDITVEFDLWASSEGDNPDAVLLNINDSNNQPAIAFTWNKGHITVFRGGYGSDIPYREIRLGDGNAPFDTWTRVKLELNWQDRMFQMYLDGEPIQGYWKDTDEPIGTSIPFRLDEIADLSSFVLSGCTKPGTEEFSRTAYLDNLKIYTGISQGTEEPPEEPDDPGEGLPMEENFNDMTVGEEPTRGSAEYNTNSSQSSEQTSIVVVEKPDGEEGDLALKIQDYTKNSGNSRYRYDFPAQKGTVAVEFDIYIPTDDPEGKGILINVNDAAGTPGIALFWEKGNIRSYRGSLSSTITFEELPVASGTAPTDTWVTMKLVMDYETKSFRIFLNGEPYGERESYPTRLDSITDFSYFAVAGCTLSDSSLISRTALLDNIKVYEIEETVVETVTLTDADGESLDSLTDVPENIKSIDVAFRTNGLNEVTLTEETVLLKEGENTVTVNLDYDSENQILHIMPVGELKREKTYTLTLKGIVDTNGQTIDEYTAQIVTRPLDFKAEVLFKNASGASIEKLTPGETVSAEIKLTNTTAQPITATIIYTVYSGNCAEQIRAKAVTIGANASETQTLEQAVPQGENLSAGVYFWDDLYQMGWQAQCQMIYQ